MSSFYYVMYLIIFMALTFRLGDFWVLDTGKFFNIWVYFLYFFLSRHSFVDIEHHLTFYLLQTYGNGQS